MVCILQMIANENFSRNTKHFRTNAVGKVKIKMKFNMHKQPDMNCSRERELDRKVASRKLKISASFRLSHTYTIHKLASVSMHFERMSKMEHQHTQRIKEEKLQ